MKPWETINFVLFSCSFCALPIFASILYHMWSLKGIFGLMLRFGINSILLQGNPSYLSGGSLSIMFELTAARFLDTQTCPTTLFYVCII